ncbi:MAG TPA: FAD-dependent monooxygenase [Actinomycetes bacterium]|nr:FAD-dependent monooxygenase [Actinomycetes bacterium]
MRIACVGGGPAGLYLAILLKRRDPGHQVTVLERNPAGVTYGWGVVFWDDLLEGLAANDPPSADIVAAEAFRWVDQRILVDGQPEARLAGYGFSMRRQRLLDILTRRALELGAEVRFECEVADEASLGGHDLVVAADGVNSRLRRAHPHSFGTRVDTGRNRYMWLGTTKVFDSFTFAFVRTPAGWIWCHAYGFDATASTFIVECSPQTWAGLGFGELGLEESTARLEELFAAQLDGHRLVAQGPDGRRARWLSFRTVTNERWRQGNLVLAGDAAHTTHFTIGSGTKLAIEDAIGLAGALGAHGDLATALAAYERDRKASLLPLQREARNSARWFESLPRYIDLGAERFALLLHQRRSQLLTRMSPSGYYRLRRTAEEFALVDRLWHWASTRRRRREVRRGTRA